MQAPAWRRSHLLIAALFLWVTALAVVDRFLPQRPALRTGIEVLLSAALLFYWVWFEGWRKFLRETVPWFVIFFPILWIADRVSGGLFNRGIGSYLCYMLAFMAAWLLHGLYLRLIGSDRADDRAAAPSWTEAWADLRAVWARRPSWAEARALSRVPTIKTVCVKANELAGVVEYETMHFAGMRVEECAADWVQQLSEARTDANGRFALPSASESPVHWVRVSWPGTEPFHLEVELTPDAQPLLVRLKPRRPTAYPRG